MEKMNTKQAEKWLKKAINRHERHMMGEEPVSGKEGDISQKLMMEEMKMAYKALFTNDVKETLWYKENVGKLEDIKM